MNIEEKISLIFGLPGKDFFDSFASKKVFIAELRPGLEGMQSVAQDFLRGGVEPIVICDNMLGFCMKRGLIKDVYIFYNALNDKTALCRTGSLIAALCAKMHGIAAYLYPSAPLTKKASSLLKIAGLKVASSDIKTYVPMLEEVPLELVKIVKREC
ncbi:MAG: hypothetical protein ABIC68_06900 [Candidatus Omnitrophota bacterium]